MKQYPSIPRSTGQSFEEFDAYVFDKLDGSNLRWEWARKQGWHKFGTRTRLFDKTDPRFGPAIDKFFNELSEPLTKKIRDQRWERAIVFTEYWGPTTLGGLQTPTDDPVTKMLTVFDVVPYKQGQLGPREFLALFDDMQGDPRVASFLGKHRWTRGFVELVYQGQLPGVSFEGVVGKSGNGRDHDIKMAKAKTRQWIEAILKRYGDSEGSKIVDS